MNEYRLLAALAVLLLAASLCGCAIGGDAKSVNGNATGGAATTTTTTSVSSNNVSIPLTK